MDDERVWIIASFDSKGENVDVERVLSTYEGVRNIVIDNAVDYAIGFDGERNDDVVKECIDNLEESEDGHMHIHVYEGDEFWECDVYPESSVSIREY